MSAFKVGDMVQWKSQAAGNMRTKYGEVVLVVPAHHTPYFEAQEKGVQLPAGFIEGLGTARGHTSYIVKAVKVGTGGSFSSRKRSGYYWPLVKKLVLVPTAQVTQEKIA